MPSFASFAFSIGLPSAAAAFVDAGRKEVPVGFVAVLIAIRGSAPSRMRKFCAVRVMRVVGTTSAAETSAGAIRIRARQRVIGRGGQEIALGPTSRDDSRPDSPQRRRLFSIANLWERSGFALHPSRNLCSLGGLVPRVRA